MELVRGGQRWCWNKQGVEKETQNPNIKIQMKSELQIQSGGSFEGTGKPRERAPRTTSPRGLHTDFTDSVGNASRKDFTETEYPSVKSFAERSPPQIRGICVASLELYPPRGLRMDPRITLKRIRRGTAEKHRETPSCLEFGVLGVPRWLINKVASL